MPGALQPRNLAIVGAASAGIFLYLRSKGATPMSTPAVQAIGDRWSSGGGTDVHTPGVATPRGDKDATLEPQLDPKGIRSDHFRDNVSSQKATEPGALGKMWHETHYGPGNGKGK